MLTEPELDRFFDAARSDTFRLEALPSYDVSVESAGIRAYLAGEERQKSDAGKAFYDYIRQQIAAGVTWRRVRVVNSPLTDYQRWQFEWGYSSTEQFGYQTFILDLAEAVDPPDLPGYDWWMFDERVVLRFHYSDTCRFLGADPIDDAEEVAAHVRYRDAALAAAVPFRDYWSAHPEYWRENRRGSRA